MVAELTDQEKLFVENVLMGMTQTQAARAAGYSRPDNRASEMMQKPHIVATIQRGKHLLAKRSRMTKDRVVEIVARAVEIAEMQGDPRSMITGAAEFAKMFGYYEPERKEVTLSSEVKERQKQLQELSDEDLLALSGDEGYHDYIEGEYTTTTPDADQDEKVPALPSRKKG